MKLKEQVIAKIKEEIDEKNAKIEIVKKEEKLPTFEEAAKEAMKPVNPILKMAIEQAEARRIKDLYHGFK
jgi:hypothetical protein